MSNRSCLRCPLAGPPIPITISRKARSFMSITRGQSILVGSNLLVFPCLIWLSINADSRLWAEVTACKSPVKCRFISSMGSTCEYPPPAAPPFIPNTGPIEGSRITHVAD